MSLVESYFHTSRYHSEHEETKKELKSLIAPNERELYSDKLSLRRDKRGSIRIVIH